MLPTLPAVPSSLYWNSSIATCGLTCLSPLHSFVIKECAIIMYHYTIAASCYEHNVNYRWLAAGWYFSFHQISNDQLHATKNIKIIECFAYLYEKLANTNKLQERKFLTHLKVVIKKNTLCIHRVILILMNLSFKYIQKINSSISRLLYEFHLSVEMLETRKRSRNASDRSTLT